MRISKEQARRHRDMVVEAAAQLFRERGFDGVSIADVMQSVGFTHGGFYNHFSSKDQLAVEAAARAFNERSDDLSKAAGTEEILRRYLSSAHSAAVGSGCPAAALAADAARQSDEVKQAFAAGIEGMIRDFSAGLPADMEMPAAERRALAVNLIAKCVGALALSRAVPSTDLLAREILSATLAGATQDLEQARKSVKVKAG